MNQNLYKLGIDIGSTTVKIAILDENDDLVFSDYERHFANIQDTLTALLEKAYRKEGDMNLAPMITGSGGLTLAKHLGVPFVQEVISVSTALQHYAAELGLVFQIVDDILDVTATTEELGKPVGSDAENDKTTFITLYGLDGARALAKQHNDAAMAALDGFGAQEDFLLLLAGELLQRKK